MAGRRVFEEGFVAGTKAVEPCADLVGTDEHVRSGRQNQRGNPHARGNAWHFLHEPPDGIKRRKGKGVNPVGAASLPRNPPVITRNAGRLRATGHKPPGTQAPPREDARKNPQGKTHPRRRRPRQCHHRRGKDRSGNLTQGPARKTPRTQQPPKTLPTQKDGHPGKGTAAFVHKGRDVGPDPVRIHPRAATPRIGIHALAANRRCGTDQPARRHAPGQSIEVRDRTPQTMHTNHHARGEPIRMPAPDRQRGSIHRAPCPIRDIHGQ
jgi:hypothetical protein